MTAVSQRSFKVDQMLIFGLGLAAAYWILEAVLYVMLSGDVSFFQRLVSFNITDIALRVLVLCFFMIFGSHAQFTMNLRRKAEDALKDSEEKYRTIIESIEDGYYELDLFGSFTFFNEAMCRILGYDAKAIMGKNIRQSMDAENAHTLFQIFDTLRQGESAMKSFEGAIIRQDGSRRFVETSVSMIKDPSGNLTGYRGLFRDVTERKESEMINQAKIAAEAANRSKGEFLANMSHEIRTPLNSITGLVELVLETDLTPDQRDDLEVVMSASYALLSIINDILDFSKIEAGKLELEQTSFNLRDFLGESLRILSLRAYEKGLELAYRVGPDVPGRVIGDPVRLRQILLNLVNNAVKFTSDGEIVVSVTSRQHTEKHAVIHFAVKDTGIGIPKEKQDSIFSPFQQADGSTTRRYGGTGLGLSISTQLVGLMGGEIWLESEAGWGSTFHFTARFGIHADKEEPLELLADYDLKGLPVLVVDDNATSRKIIQEMLESWEMKPVSASGTNDAQKLLDSNAAAKDPVSLAVIDSEMPGEDGFALVQWIRDQKDLDIKVIMTMTQSSIRSRAKLEELGVKRTVIKPVRPSDLLDAILISISPEKAPGEAAAETPETTLEKPERSLKILVVEDTPFNQKFILRLLGRWGHQATIAENGRLALVRLDKESYDLVLMDVQMPEMDGITATREIRKREEQTGGHIPIIAMTAHAMKGDRERCIEAGMDEYISKPISSETLFKTIWVLLGDKADGSSIDAAEADPSAVSTVLDKSALLKAFDQDLSFLEEMVTIFLNDYPQMLKTLKEALETKEADTVTRVAHTLKGMLRNFQAETAAQVAFKLETAGRENKFDGLDEIYEKLVAHFKTVKDVLVGLLEEIKT